MINVQSLGYTYNPDSKAPFYALQDIKLEIKAGEFVAILGANGSGKTTLARHFNGLLKPGTGCVLIDGLDTREDKNIPLIRQKVGYLFQNPENQLIAPTVGEDVAFGPENLGLPPEEIKERVMTALAQVGLEEYFDQPVQFLSGGQKQCLALAGLLAMRPDCLVLDEATSMLDPVSINMVLEIIKKLHGAGYTIIYITHNIDHAFMADRIILLDKGHLLFEGGPEDIIAAVESARVDLELPDFYKLLSGLRQMGIYIPLDILTRKQLVEFLCT